MIGIDDVMPGTIEAGGRAMVDIDEQRRRQLSGRKQGDEKQSRKNGIAAHAEHTKLTPLRSLFRRCRRAETIRPLKFVSQLGRLQVLAQMRQPLLKSEQ